MKKDIRIVFNFFFGADKHIRQEISHRQLKLYRFIEKELKDKGLSPTMREMAAEMGVKSLRSVTQYLEALQKRGLIGRDLYKQRGITIKK